MDAKDRQLLEEELQAGKDAWGYHYTGNCMGCSRCAQGPPTEEDLLPYFARGIKAGAARAWLQDMEKRWEAEYLDTRWFCTACSGRSNDLQADSCGICDALRDEAGIPNRQQADFLEQATTEAKKRRWLTKHPVGKAAFDT